MTTWVVDADRGDDRNTGRSKATAFQTIAVALRVFCAGDRLALRGWFRELPRFTVGGYDAPPSLVTADDDVPLLMGSTGVSGTWSLVTGTEYQIATPLVWTGHHIWWWPDSPLLANPLALGTAGSLLAGQYAISGGFLNVNIGAAPLAGDTFEIPLTASVNLIEIDGARNLTLDGLALRFSGADGVLMMNAPDSITLRGLDVANCIGNLLHCSIGTGTTNLDIDACYLHDQYGQQNAIGLHNATTGRVRHCTIARISKWGIASADSAIVDSLFNKLDGAKMYVVANGAGGGAHRFVGNQMVNEPPESADYDPQFWIDASVNPATPILIQNHSQARGSGTKLLRAIRRDSGIVTALDSAVYGFEINLMDGTPGVGSVSSDYMATGGGPNFSWPTGAHDIALTADPFANVSANDLRPATGSPLINAGSNGRDLGYTGAV